MVGAPLKTPVPTTIRTLWCVSPCYFDVDCFLRLREETLRSLAPWSIEKVVFVLVDDSVGMDPQAARLKALRDVRLMPAPINLGAVRAIVYGLRAISGEIRERDVVVTLDSDGED